MFTGLVEAQGKLIESTLTGAVCRIRIGSPGYFKESKIGDSVAINGCCLTLVAAEEDWGAFEAIPETLQRTTLGGLTASGGVNLERSLRVGDPIGGHFVTGHIDCTGIIIERRDDDQWSTFWIEVPEAFAAQIASKGSVAIDGVSLTIVDVASNRFSVALIPHTLAVTTLGQRKVKDRVNIETDVLAKYVQRLMASPPK